MIVLDLIHLRSPLLSSLFFFLERRGEESGL